MLHDDQEPVFRPADAIGNLEIERRGKRLHLVGHAIAVAVGHRPHHRLAGADEKHVGRRRNGHVPGVGDYRIKVDLEAGRQLDLLQVLADRIGIAACLRHWRDVEVGRGDLELLEALQVVGLRLCKSRRRGKRCRRGQSDGPGEQAHDLLLCLMRCPVVARPTGSKCRPRPPGNQWSWATCPTHDRDRDVPAVLLRFGSSGRGDHFRSLASFLKAPRRVKPRRIKKKRVGVATDPSREYRARPLGRDRAQLLRGVRRHFTRSRHRHRFGRRFRACLRTDRERLGPEQLRHACARCGARDRCPPESGGRRSRSPSDPRRSSFLPMIAASVSTRVVSWNDAAEMNESVDSDALVMPSSMWS